MKHIETPLALIQSGMDPSETLHAFSVSTPTSIIPNSGNNSISSSTNKRPHRTKKGISSP